MARAAKVAEDTVVKKTTRRTKKTEAPEAKAVETKAEDTEAKAEEKKAPAKKRTTTRKAAVKSAIYVQFAGKEFTESELLDAVKASYVSLGNKEEDIKTIEIYVKPEESAAYYVVNGEGSDEFKVEL